MTTVHWYDFGKKERQRERDIVLIYLTSLATMHGWGRVRHPMVGDDDGVDNVRHVRHVEAFRHLANGRIHLNSHFGFFFFI